MSRCGQHSTWYPAAASRSWQNGCPTPAGPVWPRSRVEEEAALHLGG